MSDSDKPRDISHLIHMKVRFPPGAKDANGKPMLSLVVREVDTEDNELAGKTADEEKTNFAFERLAISIAKVDDKHFVVGSVAGWNQIALDHALMVFDKLNGTPKAISDELIAQGEVVPAK